MIFGHMGFTYIVYNTHYINILHIYINTYINSIFGHILSYSTM